VAAERRRRGARSRWMVGNDYYVDDYVDMDDIGDFYDVDDMHDEIEKIRTNAPLSPRSPFAVTIWD